MCVNLPLFAFTWATCSFGYFLVGIYLKYLGGDFFLNVYLSAVAEITAKLLTSVFISKIGLNPYFSHLNQTFLRTFDATFYIGIFWLYHLCFCITSFFRNNFSLILFTLSGHTIQYIFLLNRICRLVSLFVNKNAELLNCTH